MIWRYFFAASDLTWETLPECDSFYPREKGRSRAIRDGLKRHTLAGIMTTFLRWTGLSAHRGLKILPNALCSFFSATTSLQPSDPALSFGRTRSLCLHPGTGIRESPHQI